jgi:hypothetical protein
MTWHDLRERTMKIPTPIAAAACSEAARLYKLAADQGGMLAGSSIRGLAGICCHGTAARQPWAVRRLASIR